MPPPSMSKRGKIEKKRYRSNDAKQLTTARKRKGANGGNDDERDLLGGGGGWNPS